MVAVVLLLTTNLVHSRVGARAAGDRDRRGSGGRVRHSGGELQAAAVRARRRAGRARRRPLHLLVPFVSPEAFPVVLSVEYVVMVAVGGLGNVYGAVAGTVAILYLEQKLREFGERAELFGWQLPDAAPTVFSFGVFGLILIGSCCSSRAGCSGDRRRNRGNSPAASGAGAPLRQPRQPGVVPLEEEAAAVVSEAQEREVLEPAVGRWRPHP